MGLNLGHYLKREKYPSPFLLEENAAAAHCQSRSTISSAVKAPWSLRIRLPNTKDISFMTSRITAGNENTLQLLPLLPNSQWLFDPFEIAVQRTELHPCCVLLSPYFSNMGISKLTSIWILHIKVRDLAAFHSISGKESFFIYLRLNDVE